MAENAEGYPIAMSNALGRLAAIRARHAYDTAHITPETFRMGIEDVDDVYWRAHRDRGDLLVIVDALTKALSDANAREMAPRPITASEMGQRSARARMVKLSPEERSTIARNAVSKRWGRQTPEQRSETMRRPASRRRPKETS